MRCHNEQILKRVLVACIVSFLRASFYRFEPRYTIEVGELQQDPAQHLRREADNNAPQLST